MYWFIFGYNSICMLHPLISLLTPHILHENKILSLFDNNSSCKLTCVQVNACKICAAELMSPCSDSVGIRHSNARRSCKTNDTDYLTCLIYISYLIIGWLGRRKLSCHIKFLVPIIIMYSPWLLLKYVDQWSEWAIHKDPAILF